MSDQLNAGATSETAQTGKTIHTKHTLSHPNKANMNDDDDGQMILGDLGGLKFPEICLTGEEKPEKTSPRKPVPTGDRTRARCVTSAHATTCSTAVDELFTNGEISPDEVLQNVLLEIAGITHRLYRFITYAIM